MLHTACPENSRLSSPCSLQHRTVPHHFVFVFLVLRFADKTISSLCTVLLVQVTKGTNSNPGSEILLLYIKLQMELFYLFFWLGSFFGGGGTGVGKATRFHCKLMSNYCPLMSMVLLQVCLCMWCPSVLRLAGNILGCGRSYIPLLGCSFFRIFLPFYYYRYQQNAMC